MGSLNYTKFCLCKDHFSFLTEVVGAGRDIDNPDSLVLGVSSGLGEGGHQQVGEQEVAQVVCGHLGLVTILSYLPEQGDTVKRRQSRHNEKDIGEMR